MKFLTALFASTLALVGGGLSWTPSVSGLQLPGNTSIPLEIDNALFRDPYSSPLGGITNGPNQALLDITLKTPCVSNMVVYVHIPDVFDSVEATATLVGPSFGPKLVEGTSDKLIPGQTTTCTLSWDNSTKILTFSNFTAGGATAQQSPDLFADKSPYWINLNFDIPDVSFNSSTVPLRLVPMPGHAQANQLKISLQNLIHFNATATNDTCTDSVVHGDPVFAGFQGQNFQFHGLPDEHFNLVSSPNVSVNAHFVYLPSGKCDYTDTPCWTHPGTYMDVLGFTIADSHIKLVAGTHEAGLRLWVDDVELTRGERVTDFNATGFVHYHRNGRVQIETDIMGFHIVNSDMFFNLQVALHESQLLRVGAVKHTITDKTVCKANAETSHHQLVESIVAAKYPVTTPLHGLIGQTWRNVKVCGNDWMGTTEDYLVSDLFANDNHYNYFSW